MRDGWVDAVIVGADRICANGDTANKIGTYGLAVLCEGARHPVLRRGTDLDRRPDASAMARRSSSRSATRERSRASRSPASSSPTAPRRHGRSICSPRRGRTRCRSRRATRWCSIARAARTASTPGSRSTPPGVEIYNPAFDVTPAEYITAFITESRCRAPPAGLRARPRRVLHG